MSVTESYTRFVAERAQPPPLTSGDIRYWDGLALASHGIKPPSRSEPVAHAAVPAQEWAGPRHRDHLYTPPRPRGLLSALPPPVFAWTTEAAGLTLYVDPALLVASPHEGVSAATGVLVWVLRVEHGECLASAVHPALLVQTAAVSLPGACVEVVPHLPVDDPLLHHMALALQAAHDAHGMASRLYAESLATALAIHFLRRYATCSAPVLAVPNELSPAKLRRTLAYIQAHLEDVLPLATLAAVAQMSPNHFAALFKRATGRTPHQYVLACRIVRAKQLLAETDAPLSAIGPQVGWTDQSYFTALFRKHVTMTPKAYRAATQRA
jgi:AraC-like DNA-binding protein